MRKTVFLVMILCSVLSLLEGWSQAADPYVLGYQTDVTGPGNNFLAPQMEGFALYIQGLNDRGGINGHPVKVLYEDDKSSPSRAGAIATKFILEDKVLAILGLGLSLAHPPVYKLAKEHGVPVITGYSDVAEVWDPVKYDRREIFASGSIMTPTYTSAAVMIALPLPRIFSKGATFGAMTYATPGGRVISAGGAKLAEEKGFKVVYHEDIPPGTVDVSPWAQKIVQAKPDLLWAGFAADVNIALWSELNKLGFKGALMTGDVIGTRDFLKSVDIMINAKNEIYYPSYFELPTPFGDTPLAEYDLMRKAMEKYGHKFELSNQHAYGWVAARIIEAALQRVGWPADRSGLLKALEETNLDTHGLTPGPIVFTPTDHRGPEYAKIYKWDYKEMKMKTVGDWVIWKAKDFIKE